MKYILTACLFTLSVILLHGKSSDSAIANSGYTTDSSGYGTNVVATPPPPPSSKATSDSTLQDVLNALTALLPAFVLVFGVFMTVFLIKHSADSKKFSADHTIKIVSITLLVTGLLFVVSLAQGVGQPASLNVIYAPAFGLLGTLAGYMLGKGLLGGKEPEGGGGDTGEKK